jgi:hypothetical protein
VPKATDPAAAQEAEPAVPEVKGGDSETTADSEKAAGSKINEEPKA